ncbi:MAG: heat-inducible transcription repressor HrcA [Candidatus Eremiobacteraeota bacterium]|nr:heat-inducible transcription repressor HrcA [Candidatus Eremiobacteraeota bacterium]MBV8222822.1 heat-inducible transcription repressor HrcA [Candidatus Eremiobacteraeota bacterium]
MSKETNKASEPAPTPELDRRKTSILGTVVYEYIATGEPVGSATLTQKYNLGVSPATVRAEMAALEDEGYLDQPHTSAGRVPSDLGYRYYVDRLIQPEVLGTEERELIRTEIHRARTQLDSAVDHASHVLSNLTRSIAFAVSPRLDSQTYRHLQLIWVNAHHVHVVLVTELGTAAQATIESAREVDPDQLTRACNTLNARLAGRRLNEINAALLTELTRDNALPAELLRALAAMFATHGDLELERRLFAGGANNLLDQQEFRDFRTLRAILELLEEQQTLYRWLQESLQHEGATVSIGHELGSADMNECSVVTIPYKVGDRTAGALGVLGPRRMQYARLLSLISHVADSLNTLFQNETPA